MTISDSETSRKKSAWRPRLRYVLDSIQSAMILLWTGFWLYLSLSMVIVSFSAIQLQTKVIDQAKQGYVPPVALIVLNYKRYEEDLKHLSILQNQKKSSNLLPDDRSISEITVHLYPKLFSPDEKFPANTSNAIQEKCENPKLEAEIRAECNIFISKIQGRSLSDQSVSSKNETKLDGEDSVTVKVKVNKYENQPEFGIGADLDVHQALSSFLLPWLPPDMRLSTLPHPTLVLLVTISMGALGGVLFMLQLHFVSLGGTSINRTSLSWHIFRPFQGMTTALAIFLLVKAGQISVSHDSGIDEADLNPFVLGFLGVVSGLLSDQAIDRLSAAGIELFKTRDDPAGASNGAHARDGAGAATPLRNADKPAGSCDTEQKQTGPSGVDEL